MARSRRSPAGHGQVLQPVVAGAKGSHLTPPSTNQCSIHCLPVELIYMIFMSLDVTLPDDFSLLRDLRLVCRLWLSVVNSSREMWSNVIFRGDELGRGVSNWNTCRYLQQDAKLTFEGNRFRVTTKPLHVGIEWNHVSTSDWWKFADDFWISIYCGAIWSQLVFRDRTVTLSLRGPCPYIHLFPADPLLCKRLTELSLLSTVCKSWELKFYMSQVSIDLPNLHSLTISNYDLASLPRLNTPRLRNLNLLDLKVGMSNIVAQDIEVILFDGCNFGADWSLSFMSAGAMLRKTVFRNAHFLKEQVVMIPSLILGTTSAQVTLEGCHWIHYMGGEMSVTDAQVETHHELITWWCNQRFEEL